MTLLNLPKFIAWLETKDPNEKFNYLNNYNCALAQYAKAHGYSNVYVLGYKWFLDGDQDKSEYLGIFGGIAKGDHIWTFGAVLKNAKKELAKSEESVII